jgi:hypothetical protein
VTTVPRATVRRPLLGIVVVAVALMIARVIWPELKLDSTSLILFAIAAIAWALAYLPISRFKAGDYEIELVHAVDTLKQKVSQIETADRVTGELERKVLATEVAVATRGTHTGEHQPGSVMRGDPADRKPESERSAALEEFRRMIASAASDKEKIARAVDLVERTVRDSAATGTLDSFRKINAEVQSDQQEPAPRLTNEVLDLAWRLIVLQTSGDERRL